MNPLVIFAVKTAENSSRIHPEIPSVNGFVRWIYWAIGIGFAGAIAIMSLNLWLDLKIQKKKRDKKEKDAALVAFKKDQKKKARVNEARQGFVAASSLYTEAEQKFHEVLKSLNLEEYSINGKTRLADIAQAPVVAGKTDYSRFNQVAQKHVDFLLLAKETNAPALVIELDDSSHQRPDRKARDELVDAILEECGIPILHYPCQHYYDLHTVKQKILEKLTPKTVNTLSRAS